MINRVFFERIELFSNLLNYLESINACWLGRPSVSFALRILDVIVTDAALNVLQYGVRVPARVYPVRSSTRLPVKLRRLLF